MVRVLVTNVDPAEILVHDGSPVLAVWRIFGWSLCSCFDRSGTECSRRQSHGDTVGSCASSRTRVYR
jgi:hypothetical protein